MLARRVAMPMEGAEPFLAPGQWRPDAVGPEGAALAARLIAGHAAIWA